MAIGDARVPSSIRWNLRAGAAGVLIFFGGVGGWAATTDLAGAVIAAGSLVVDSDVKKVQHPTGGIVGQLYVRDGDQVKGGDIVVRLDDTTTRANVAVMEKSLDELGARGARLQAELDDAQTIGFPADLLSRSSDPVASRVMAGEQRLFQSRRAARAGQKAQFGQRISQLEKQAQAIEEQVAAKQLEIDLIGRELKGVRTLWQQNLIQISRLTMVERDDARIRGERGALLSSIAQVKDKIVETQLQIIQVDQDLRAEAGKDLAEIRAKTSELVEKHVAAEDQLKRVDIRAPQDGKVHQLTVHTIGGVINAGEPIMLIVPEERLVVEVRIEPRDIDQVKIGHAAVLRFPAFNQRTTPELNGEVDRVSADVSQDQKSGARFYTVRITILDNELARLKDFSLIPGMPVEAFLQTGRRTVMSFLIKPISDQVSKAWRER
ncbi:HlyD family type I secretion periplasmic adaptor subunit [Bosea sp. F3-2]|uniref:HlyD family type I secretion periplasmic adaptor subunit n=1 Tax=Bosea sp. F3-2 TaxID=2599640 RepID=UPI0011F00C8E|nr:HlyD family type I secretion periplasmic adaptor subunit [Bosea sp. F3-2]QEL24748.1 HlyD family type I secretion periplasmic adaptor subunit [Bosea sp. F3-2]